MSLVDEVFAALCLRDQRRLNAALVRLSADRGGADAEVVARGLLNLLTPGTRAFWEEGVPSGPLELLRDGVTAARDVTGYTGPIGEG